MNEVVSHQKCSWSQCYWQEVVLLDTLFVLLPLPGSAFCGLPQQGCHHWRAGFGTWWRWYHLGLGGRFKGGGPRAEWEVGKFSQDRIGSYRVHPIVFWDMMLLSFAIHETLRTSLHLGWWQLCSNDPSRFETFCFLRKNKAQTKAKLG